MINKERGLEKVLWSIAIPGFGQLLNRRYFKGILLISLEFLINMGSHLNTAIILSFYGKMELAVDKINYQWLMFYPCLYMFAIWDAYNDAEEQKMPFSFLPFAMAAYLGTIGVIYSGDLRLTGVLLGPIWLPLIFIVLGLIIGFFIRNFLIKRLFLN